MNSSIFRAFALVIAGGALSLSSSAQVWTDAKDESLPVDFSIQGEYADEGKGVQVIALGGGAFQAVVYEGGLPGAGWDGESRSLLVGSLNDRGVRFLAAEGDRRYLAQEPDAFSATREFPPAGHNKAYRGGIPATGDFFALAIPGGDRTRLPKVVRESPTLGAEAPEGALVLFDSSGTDAWAGGRLDTETGLLNTDGNDIRTKESFQNYTMHVEFMLPYRPDARGQGRGNSGFYQVDHYEVQILDSFGLEGLNNECGGVYTKADPLVNMCLPPLTWQTYDVTFHNAVVENGEKVKNATMTLKHNGVVIHDGLEIDGKTGGARSAPEGTPGPIKLQGHGNPLQFRNIWIVAE